ncbi:MAG: hypothetical protein IJ685_04985 [Selenomonadaceae bacterium]|nr:hypothetical protein [Selenomonadaceae bacterium]
METIAFSAAFVTGFLNSAIRRLKIFAGGRIFFSDIEQGIYIFGTYPKNFWCS